MGPQQSPIEPGAVAACRRECGTVGIRSQRCVDRRRERDCRIALGIRAKQRGARRLRIDRPRRRRGIDRARVPLPPQPSTRQIPSELECMAHGVVLVGLASVGLAAVVVAGLVRLSRGDSGEASTVAIAVAAASLVALTVLSIREAPDAKLVSSQALMSDAHLSAIGAAESRSRVDRRSSHTRLRLALGRCRCNRRPRLRRGDRRRGVSQWLAELHPGKTVQSARQVLTALRRS